MVEPKHQGLVIPKSFSLNFYPERIVTKVHYTSGRNATEEQQLANIESNNQHSKLKSCLRICGVLLLSEIYNFVSSIFSLMFFIGDVATPAAVSRKHGSTHSSQPIKTAKAASDSTGKSGSSTRKRACSYMSLSQRKERHNRKERERR